MPGPTTGLCEVGLLFLRGVLAGGRVAGLGALGGDLGADHGHLEYLPVIPGVTHRKPKREVVPRLNAGGDWSVSYVR